MQSPRAALVIVHLVLLSSFLSISAQAQKRFMQLLGPGQGWAVDKEGLFWTQDDGVSWKNISPPGARYFNDVFFLDTSRGWALFSSDANREGTLAFHLAITVDGGATWLVSAVKTRDQEPDEFDGTAWLDLVDPQHGWLVLRRKSNVAFSMGWLLTTDDGGKIWKQLPDPPIANRPSFATAETGWLAGGAGGDDLYATHDAGKTWRAEDLRPPPSALRMSHRAYGRPQFGDSRHGFLPVTFSLDIDAKGPRTSALVLFTTNNSGESWNPDRVVPSEKDMYGAAPFLATLVDSTLLFFPLSDRKHLTMISIGGDGRLNSLRTAVDPPDSDVREMSFATPTQGWVLTNGDRLLSTTDGGANWKWLVPGASRRDLPSPSPPLQTSPLKRLGEGPPSSSQLYLSPHLGFDQQHVTTVANMQTWFDWSPFFDVGIYVGGANYCYKSGGTCLRYDPGLTANWITQTKAQGWGFMPIWVGPQAPCNTGMVSLFSSIPATAQSQGMTEADSASNATQIVGYAIEGAGCPPTNCNYVAFQYGLVPAQ